MKSFFKYLAASILAVLARRVIRKYRPTVVMVTGSVGKTSTKDAVAAALSQNFFVRWSEKSYNSEFGVPLTIFGVANPWASPLAWLRVFKEALALALLPNHYPNMLVLEVGADRPGDLEKILRIATPDVVVVTRLPEVPVHVEAYATPEAVREEEFGPAYALPPAGPLIISSEDEHAERMALRLPVRTLLYGANDNAHVRILNAEYMEEDGRVVGMMANIAAGETVGGLSVRGAVGQEQLFSGAAAIAAAIALDVPFAEALTALSSYLPPPGRMRLFKGVNGIALIDDSYNASPVAVEASLRTLSAFPNARRRIAVLGDMLELGRYSVAEHARVGELAAKSVDMLITAGLRSREAGAAALAAGLSADCHVSFDTAKDAALALPGLVKEGDAVLVKGSQSMRMERVVEALLADKADLKNLVRQDREWRRR